MHRMLQEPIVTQRHGRSVLSVKVEHKGKFPGLVIDQSSSGATVFMEPLAVLELSNKLRAHQLAEEKEVEAILHALSGLIGHDAHDLLMACEELGHLDSLTAQASYALKVGAILPEVGDDIPVRLSTARHPLLIHKGITPVPITIEVGGSFRTPRHHRPQHGRQDRLPQDARPPQPDGQLRHAHPRRARLDRPLLQRLG